MFICTTLDTDNIKGKTCFINAATSGIGRSKLANIKFTYELARRLGDSGVTANALHPGHAATDIFRTNFPLVGPLLKWVIRLFALSPKGGTDKLILLASSPDLQRVTGRCFVKLAPAETAPITQDLEQAARLWSVSEHMTGLAS